MIQAKNRWGGPRRNAGALNPSPNGAGSTTWVKPLSIEDINRIVAAGWAGGLDQVASGNAAPRRAAESADETQANGPKVPYKIA
jgi:hypothetical protein